MTEAAAPIVLDFQPERIKRFEVTATVPESPFTCNRCGRRIADRAPLFIGTDWPSDSKGHVFLGAFGLCCFEAEHRTVYERRRLDEERAKQALATESENVTP